MQLPKDFTDMLARMGDWAFDRLPEALATESPVSVRFNAAKGKTPPDGADLVPWCPAGCYLPERPAFTFDPALHQGLYYVQDASSMFIARVIAQLTASGSPVRYLDACAAPGGKTTAAFDSLPAGSLVVANEFVPARAAVLRENLTKWGAPLCVVTQGSTERFAADGARFDIIAADVPCSGEGMMRKDAKAVEQWTPALVDQCVARQCEIVDNLWPALAPGGYFIYSTCTFNRRENEEMVSRLVNLYGAEPIEIEIDPAWGIHGAVDSPYPCYRFLPGQIRGEGLFMAVVRKPLEADDSAAASPRRDKSRREKPGRDRRGGGKSAIPAEIARWVKGADLSAAEISADGIITLPLPTLCGESPYRPRLELATLKGRDLIPSHALAMSTLLRPDAFPQVELPSTQAIDYLRCQAVILPPETPRGIILATHQGHPLGWLKNIGPRANNLYPKPWRILSTH